jgi:4-amino-4-deoxy-L-arabinose transferase-like glycosyltransferase
MPEALESGPAPRSLREAWREPELRALALAALVAYFARLWEGSLDGDPVIYASVAKGVAQGHWLDLHLGSLPYWNKPPLLFWLTAPLFLVFGTTTFAACFWPAAFGAASCLVMHRLAREVFDRPTALFAALAMLLTPELLRYGSRFRLESAVVFFTLLAVLDAWRAVQGGSPDRLRRVGLWIGCLFLAKGGPGFIALGVVAAFLTASRAGALLRTRAALQGLGILLLLGASWPLLQWLQHGNPWLAHTFGQELFQADTDDVPAQNPLLFYGWRMLRANSLWLVLGLLGLRIVWSERGEHRDRWRLVACWLGVSLLLISLPERLYSRYLNAVHPTLALLSGLWLARRLDPTRFDQVSRWLPRATFAAAVVLLFLPYPIHRDEARPVRALDAALHATSPGREAVPFYGDVHTFTRGDFHFHIDRDVERFASLAEADGLPVLVASWRTVPELRAAGWRPLTSGWQWQAFAAPETRTQALPSGISPDSRRLE